MVPVFRSVALIVILIVTSGAAAQRAPRSGFNLGDRGAIISSWDSEFNRTEPAMEWTGDVNTCNPGTTSEAYQQSVLQRVNWLRRMAGVPDVTYRADLNAQQQAGALISAANRALNHTPDPSAKCWTQAGYDSTSTSNLFLGVFGANAMDGYVHDFGDNNKVVGHRWWLLHPGLKTITTGDIPVNVGVWPANALHVVSVDWNTTSTRDGFVAWPPPGYVPAYVVYPRWSLMTFSSSNRADFSNAMVTVTGPNGPLSVSYDYRGPERIVFVPAGFEKAPLKFPSDYTYTVNITGITGGSTSSYSYAVTATPSNWAPAITRVTVLKYGLAVDKCARQGRSVGYVSWTDRDGDTPVSISLVDGDGAVDNELFSATSDDRETWQVVTATNLDGVKRDFSVRLRITDARGASSESINTFSLLDTADGRCKALPTTRRTVTGSMIRGTSRPLRSFTTLPAGTVTYETSGKCSLSANNRRIVATAKGSCTVVLTGSSSNSVSLTTLSLRIR
jgi:hypothetical protein